MVILNDVGLTLEIIGFVVFLFIPISKSSALLTEQLGRVGEFFYKHQKFESSLRYIGIGLIIIGLIMQYGFLQSEPMFEDLTEPTINVESISVDSNSTIIVEDGGWIEEP